jgi:hypothetical protein
MGQWSHTCGDLVYQSHCETCIYNNPGAHPRWTYLSNLSPDGLWDCGTVKLERANCNKFLASGPATTAGRWEAVRTSLVFVQRVSRTIFSRFSPVCHASLLPAPMKRDDAPLGWVVSRDLPRPNLPTVDSVTCSYNHPKRSPCVN